MTNRWLLIVIIKIMIIFWYNGNKLLILHQKCKKTIWTNIILCLQCFKMRALSIKRNKQSTLQMQIKLLQFLIVLINNNFHHKKYFKSLILLKIVLPSHHNYARILKVNHAINTKRKIKITIKCKFKNKMTS